MITKTQKKRNPNEKISQLDYTTKDRRKENYYEKEISFKERN